MSTGRNPSRLPRLAPLAAALLVAACSGGGGSGEDFGVASVNLQPNAVWQINRPIVIEFTKAVDFSTVNLNTINIRQPNGAPSAGEFFLKASNIVVFQPRCPTKDDLSDAGLLPGGVAYELNLLGLEDSPLTVRSTDGDSLEESETRPFTTPVSTVASNLFFDPTPGPPTPVVRTTSPSDTNPNATYLEVGGDPDARHYFERNPSTGVITLDPPIEVPLNLLSLQASQVAIVLYINQPVDPASSNISSERIPLQYRDQVGLWQDLVASVTLVANCTQTGSILRIEPEGILPPDSTLRAVVTPEFRDIVGDTNLVQQDNFARADIQPAPSPLVDEYLEEFATQENFDAAAAFPEPLAEWANDGKLRAAFSFSGTGGPNGNFDWLVPTGAFYSFDTTSETITGGPGFSNSIQVTVIGGVLDVRHLRIEQGATLSFTGPNPVTILASGKVEIFGTIEVSGTSNAGVNTLNTTNIPEPGSPGQAGGGRGGTGSPLVTASSPKGGNGFGAFNIPDGGGVGGETGWNADAASQLARRRGAGGGGGVFGKNQPRLVGTGGTWDQTFLGLDAEPGFDNLTPPSGNFSGSKGAITGDAGPLGGPVGPSPFVDLSASNDFFGTMIDTASQTIIQGELKKPWAGAGGGGGGDASFVGIGGSFPMSPFNPAGDEKAAGGGGGGGSLHVLALQDIVFGANGRIRARGGTGGGGENTNFTNRVGGGSGGGSGGHVILEAAGKVDLSLVVLGPPNTLDVAIIATGGQGGVGANSIGGATATMEGSPVSDACPPGYPDQTMLNGCRGHVDGAGGDGGPGIIQFHTSNGLDPVDPDILLPVGKTLVELCKPTPLCDTTACRLAPGFGRLSRARSEWIALGEGSYDPTSTTPKNVMFDFGGIDPVTGLVQTTGTTVTQLPPILGPTPLAAAPTLPHIAQNGAVLVVSAAALMPTHQPLLDNTALLKDQVIELSEIAVPTNAARFTVTAATYDSAAGTLTLMVDPAGPPLTSFTPPTAAQVALRPAYFRVFSSGTADFLPLSATVQIQFQATVPDVGGDPDPTAATPLTSDITDLNTDPANEDFRFVRFEVLFDIDAQSTGLDPSKPIPALEFLRMPFRYN